MTVGDIRSAIKTLPDNMEFYVVHGDRALFPCGIGTAQLGTAADFKESGLSIVQGLTVFEITARDNP